MAGSSSSELTQILIDARAGRLSGSEATDRLFELVYDELRRLAASLMRGERADHTLQATALVHEAYSRLVDATRIDWQSRAHFFGVAARAMRQILVDHARKRARVKRGGGWQRITLDDQLGLSTPPQVDIIELDEALLRLGEMDDRMARVVELRIFAGMDVREVAQFLGISRSTVHEDWRVANMWLSHQIAKGDAG